MSTFSMEFGIFVFPLEPCSDFLCLPPTVTKVTCIINHLDYFFVHYTLSDDDKNGVHISDDSIHSASSSDSDNDEDEHHHHRYGLGRESRRPPY